MTAAMVKRVIPTAQMHTVTHTLIVTRVAIVSVTQVERVMS